MQAYNAALHDFFSHGTSATMQAHHADIVELIRAAEARAYNAGYQDGVKDRPAKATHVGRAAGGAARAASLSPERRSEIARNAANSRWTEKNAESTHFYVASTEASD